MFSLIRSNLKRAFCRRNLCIAGGYSLFWFLLCVLSECDIAIAPPNSMMVLHDMLDFAAVFAIPFAIHYVLRGDTGHGMLVPRMTLGLKREEVYCGELVTACVVGQTLWWAIHLPTFIMLLARNWFDAQNLIVFMLVGAIAAFTLSALCALLELNIKNAIVTTVTAAAPVLLYYVGWLPLALGMPDFMEFILNLLAHLFPPLAMDVESLTPISGMLWEYPFVAVPGFALFVWLGLKLFRKKDLK